jgi:hypothetical protein
MFFSLAAGISLVGGCSGDMPLDDARTAVVADVDGATLDGATLERLLLAAPRNVAPSVTASVLLSAFIEAGALRSAMLRGDTLTDSTTVAQSIMPDAVRGVIMEYFNVRANSMPPVTDEAADSAVRAGAVRTFQHILVRINPTDDSLTIEAAKVRARDLWQELQGGADFEAVMRRASEDTVSRANRGLLPSLTRADVPPTMVDKLWALQPGEFASPMYRGEGYHIMRRVVGTDAREPTKRWLAPRFARLADSIYVDSLSNAAKLEIPAEAINRLRMMVREPLPLDGEAPLAKWEGGAMEPAEARMWISVLPTSERATMRTAPDSSLVLFLREIAQRELVGGMVTAERRLLPKAWDALAPQYRSAVTGIVAAYHPILTPGDATNTTRAFLDSVTGGTTPYRPLPGALGAVLRGRSNIVVNYEAFDAIVANAGKVANARVSDSLEGATPPPAAPPAP